MTSRITLPLDRLNRRLWCLHSHACGIHRSLNSPGSFGIFDVDLTKHSLCQGESVWQVWSQLVSHFTDLVPIG